MRETEYLERKYPQIQRENEYLERKYPERGKNLRTGELFGIFSKGIRRGKIKLFIYAILANVMLLSLILSNIMVYGVGIFINGGLEYNLLLLVMVLLFILSIGGAIAYNPKTWDNLPMIYENGISTSFSPFLSFSDVDEIGYGIQVDGGRFIELFSRKRPWKKCPLVREREYANEFFLFLIRILKEKCPNVPWKKYESIGLIKHGWQYHPGLQMRGPDEEWEQFVDEKLIAAKNRFWAEEDVLSSRKGRQMKYRTKDYTLILIAVFMILAAPVRAIFNRDGANIVIGPLFIGIGLFLLYGVHKNRRL